MALVTLYSFGDRVFNEKYWENADDFVLSDFQDNLTHWINVDGKAVGQISSQIGEKFGIHPLILDDITNAKQRPRIDSPMPGELFVILRMLVKNRQEPEQVTLLLKNNVIVSFQEGLEGDVFDHVREKLCLNRVKGMDHLLYLLLDAVIDGYLDVAEELDESISHIEARMIESPEKGILKEIFEIKKRMVLLSSAARPMIEITEELIHGEAQVFVGKNFERYFEDLHHHLKQVLDEADSLKERASMAVDMYLTSINGKLNEVMKVLTVFSTIFIPLTFIASLYGMNFKYMPELDTPWGYPVVLGTMFLMLLCMLYYFKKKKWF